MLCSRQWNLGCFCREWFPITKVLDLKMYFFKVKPSTSSSEKPTAFYVTMEYENEFRIHTLGLQSKKSG